MTLAIVILLGCLLALIVYLVLRWCLVDAALVRVVYDPTERNNALVDSLGNLRKYFPTPYLSAGVLHCAYANHGRIYGRAPTEVEYIPGSRDDQPLRLIWAEVPPRSTGSTPVVLLVHGLVSNHDEGYLHQMMQRCTADGWRCLTYLRRGCQPQPTSEPQYHYGDPEFPLVAAFLKKRYPEAPLYAIGYSAGGNVLARHLGIQGTDTLFDGAVVISSVFNWDTASAATSGWVARWVANKVQTTFLSPTQVETLRGEKYAGQGLDIERALRTKCIREFDECISRRLFGYDTLQDFYHDASAEHHLHNIGVPVLCVRAEDDPMFAKGLFPHETLRRNRNVIVVDANRGGHVGFATGWWPFHLRGSWADTLALEYLRGLDRIGSTLNN